MELGRAVVSLWSLTFSIRHLPDFYVSVQRPDLTGIAEVLMSKSQSARPIECIDCSGRNVTLGIETLLRDSTLHFGALFKERYH